MGEAILAVLSNLFNAIGSVFGFVKQRDSELNTPGVEAAAIAQKEQDAQDKTRKAIAKGDLEEERRELAE